MTGKDRSKYLYINSRDEFFRIDITRIVYFESDGNYTNIVLTNGSKATVGMNLMQTQRLLSDNLRDAASIFARIGKRYIVNLSYVFHIAILRQRLTLSDGAGFSFALNISKEALKGLREMYVKTKENCNG